MFLECIKQLPPSQVIQKWPAMLNTEAIAINTNKQASFQYMQWQRCSLALQRRIEFGQLATDGHTVLITLYQHWHYLNVLGFTILVAKLLWMGLQVGTILSLAWKQAALLRKGDNFKLRGPGSAMASTTHHGVVQPHLCAGTVDQIVEIHVSQHKLDQIMGIQQIRWLYGWGPQQLISSDQRETVISKSGAQYQVQLEPRSYTNNMAEPGLWEHTTPYAPSSQQTYTPLTLMMSSIVFNPTLRHLRDRGDPTLSCKTL